MLEHFKRILGEERYNQILQEAEGETYEELLDERDILQQENQELKEKIKGIQEERDYLFNKLSIENKYLTKENKQLKEKINTYENPEDMTLMFMYCDEKAKDKIKQLKERVDYLERSNNRREETIINLRHEQQLDKYKEVVEAVNNIIKMKKRTLGYDTNDSYLRSIEETLDKVKEVG